MEAWGPLLCFGNGDGRGSGFDEGGEKVERREDPLPRIVVYQDPQEPAEPEHPHTAGGPVVALR
jgi:hypothetical protein